MHGWMDGWMEMVQHKGGEEGEFRMEEGVKSAW